MMKLNTEIANDILAKIIKREHRTFSKYACLSQKAYRFNEEELPDRKNIRTPFFHDTDKIIHSLAYTRYIDKTQVFYLFENDNITHRVLHVQLVSKIARVIGRALSLNEDLIEAISLGHDLGHVPYGHNGEKMLNKLMLDNTNEYFCHNAQSVRALHYLEDKGNGLNLTVQVLDGILCHNGELMQKEYKPDYKKTKEQFIQEYKCCWTTKDFSAKIIAMTLEGCVMRIADVVAYIGRDLEDAIILKLIKRKEIPESISKIIGNTNATIINNFVIPHGFGYDITQKS
ncbi:MAG: HD domain-containing protein [Bacteroidales bacterium]|nr:HD domain-containing protein [Bacteroidales bacterium]MDD2612016.1 HD domain-containing protein [Bacteroidales bacterium]